jgi:cytochrome P450
MYGPCIIVDTCFQVFLEILRLYPPAVATSRETVSDDLKLSGYTIPKGAMISISYIANQRNPEHWEDPETFDPNRFNPDRGK